MSALASVYVSSEYDWTHLPLAASAHTLIHSVSHQTNLCPTGLIHSVMSEMGNQRLGLRSPYVRLEAPLLPPPAKPRNPAGPPIAT
jgi:hypothetical protein